MIPIDTAAVLGSGVMGSAIAAHLAGAGIRTLLLDIVPKGAMKSRDSRNQLALQGLQRALSAKPAAFYDPDAARLVEPGNIEDDLPKLRHCDLVVEAVVENLDIKRALWANVVKNVGPHTILASNTSGLPIAEMSAALPAEARPRFLGMHFFNPVRYMKLLELTAAPDTSQETLRSAAALGEALGKGVVYAKDTPNFIANRIGIYALMQVFHRMAEHDLSIEAVDKIAGPPMGRPKSAVFRTADIVGIDTLLHVADHCHRALTQDPEREVFAVPQWIRALVTAGRLGQKSGAGFYKKVGADILVLDPTSLEYRPQNKVRFESLGAVRNIEDVGQRVKELVGAQVNDQAAKFAWAVLSRTLAYSAQCVGEIADDIVNIDRAMRWGFNWDLGPFETWDAIGVADSVARMKKDGVAVPEWVTSMLSSGRTTFYAQESGSASYFDVGRRSSQAVPTAPHTLSLAILKASPKRVVRDNLGATLVDLGDGCLCVEFHTKMNTIDGDVMEMVLAGIEEAEKNHQALVIGNDGAHFSAGANLMLVYLAAEQGEWAQIGKLVDGFQTAVQRIKYARVPVVAAPFQYTFGGSTEMVMACAAVQAWAETYMGLVEAGAGVIPAGGGCLRMVERWSHGITDVPGADLLPSIGQAALQIAMAKVSTSAEEARHLRYLRDRDGISLGRDLLLADAKALALGLARSSYRAPRPPVLKALGADGVATILIRIQGMVEGGFASDHDALISQKIAHVLCGGAVAAGTDVDEAHFLALEKEAFLSLCGEAKSRARMQAILTSGKPLRN